MSTILVSFYPSLPFNVDIKSTNLKMIFIHFRSTELVRSAPLVELGKRSRTSQTLYKMVSSLWECSGCVSLCSLTCNDIFQTCSIDINECRVSCLFYLTVCLLSAYSGAWGSAVRAGYQAGVEFVRIGVEWTSSYTYHLQRWTEGTGERLL